MQPEELISVREYRSTSYEPDRDYIDGVLEERNKGETDHSYFQTAVASYFHERRKKWGVCALTEQRVQVSKTRFRVPDVCLVIGPKPDQPIISTSPFVCIEILSPEDRVSKVRERLKDYIRFGVPYVFLLDPETHKAYRWTTADMTEVFELRTENPDTLVPLEALFE